MRKKRNENGKKMKRSVRLLVSFRWTFVDSVSLLDDEEADSSLAPRPLLIGRRGDGGQSAAAGSATPFIR